LIRQEGSVVNIIWTVHAEERQHQWHTQLGITRLEIEKLLSNPTQVVPGDLGVSVAQIKRANGLLRVPFVDVAGGRKVLTLYWTSKVSKYWREEENANSV
jgi:hypothetical protein